MNEKTNEQRLDLLAELIDPAAEIFGDPELQKLVQSGAAPLKYVKPAIKNHKQAFITVLAVLEDTDPKDYIIPPPGIFFMKILSLFTKPEVKALFTLQSQTSGKGFSGSAMANTEDGAN